MDEEKAPISASSSDTASTVSTAHESVYDARIDLESGGGEYPAPALYATPLHPTVSSEKNLAGVLSRTISRVRTSDTLNPGPPPDGGTQAWMMVALSHLVIFNTWGFINSFGLFETYYTNTLHLGPPSQIAWIGSVQIFILFGLGTFSGRATDAGFFRITFIIGTAMQLIGIFMTSLCRTYWQVFLAQGVCVGLGNGLVFVPSVALTSTYFLRNRSLALGCAASGSATGGLIFPAIAETLLPKVGFGWTVRTMGFVQLVGMLICCVFMKPRLPPRKTGPIVEWKAFGEKSFALFCGAAFFLFWGIYVGFYYVGSFARDILHTDQTTSINLLLTMNGVGLPSRIIPAYFADRNAGPLNMILPFAGISAVLLYSWAAVDSVSGIWVFAVAYGMLAAGVQGLFPAVLTSLTSDPKKLGVRTGMGFGVAGFACLSGPPIAGALVEMGNGTYLYAQLFAGTAMVISFALLSTCRWTRIGFRLARI